MRTACWLSLGWLLSCCACSHESAPAPSPTSPAASASQAPAASPAETVVTLADDGKSYDLDRGATLTFKLEGHSGTGYAWVASGVDGKVLAPQGDATTEVLDPGLPGGRKVDVLRFTAAGAGTSTVELDLKRPFAPSDPPAKVVKVTVRVR